MTYQEVLDAIKNAFPEVSIVSVKCTIKAGNGKIGNADILVADCDDIEFDDCYGHIVDPNKHWYICCGIDDFDEFYEDSFNFEVLEFHSVEPFKGDC